MITRINFYQRSQKKLITQNLRKKLNKILEILVELENLGDYNYEVSLSFLTSEEIKDLNFKYRNINKSTDVLSFPQNLCFRKIYDLGDIFVNFELLNELSSKQISKDGKKVQDFKEEICAFWFLHGLLHLFGYDHQNDIDEKLMNERQKKVMEKLNKL